MPTGLGVVLALLLAAFVCGAPPAARREPSPPAALEGTPATALAVNVSWNGIGVANASAAATAFPISPGQVAAIEFAFAGGAASTVTNATVLLGFAGAVLSRDSVLPTVGPSDTGRAEIDWSFGNLYAAIEGVYPLTAELRAANGTVLFTTQFFIDARAPYVVGSAAVVFLGVLGAVELGWIVAAVRRERRRQRRFRSR